MHYLCRVDIRVPRQSQDLRQLLPINQSIFMKRIQTFNTVLSKSITSGQKCLEAVQDLEPTDLAAR